MAAIGINGAGYSKSEMNDWAQVQKGLVTWPVGFDVNGATTKSIFKPNDPQFSYVFIDRKMRLRKFQMQRLEDVFAIVEKLLKEPA